MQWGFDLTAYVAFLAYNRFWLLDNGAHVGVVNRRDDAADVEVSALRQHVARAVKTSTD